MDNWKIGCAQIRSHTMEIIGLTERMVMQIESKIRVCLWFEFNYLTWILSSELRNIEKMFKLGFCGADIKQD